MGDKSADESEHELMHKMHKSAHEPVHELADKQLDQPAASPAHASAEPPFDSRALAPVAAPPAFATRDPNTPQFWDERFERRYMPWDQQGVPPAFAEFATALAPCPVLIPGCGSAYEAGWLAQHAWPVTAIDFSGAAVQAARTQLASVEGTQSVSLHEADFFTFEPPLPPDWIYERAFLCALPPSKRGAYARRMAELAAPGCLLAGLFFLGESTKKGPPFAIVEAELHELLSPYFECIDQHAVSGSLAVFAGAERWLTWRRLG
jgi:hypothetical protein